MGRTCTVCRHPAVAEVDRAIVAGEANRRIAAQYGLSEAAIRRHAAHVPATLAKATEAVEIARADDLVAQIAALRDRAVAILDQAERDGDLRTALQAIREARSTLELLAKLAGELQQEGTVNIVLSPQWVEIRAVVVRALEPFPDARVAVADALESLHA